jgi:hypothetical protein
MPGHVNTSTLENTNIQAKTAQNREGKIVCTSSWMDGVTSVHISKCVFI